MFESTKEFMRFHKNLPTIFKLSDFPCPICGFKIWKPRSVDVKTVIDNEGKS